MRIRTFFKKIAVCTLSAAVLLSPASVLGADIQTDMTSAESQDTESAASETEDLYGVEAYANLEAIYQNFPQRINDENNRSENVTNAGLWIQSQLESYGYEVSTHDFTHFDFTGTNYFVTKPGKSDKTIIIGAHYDSLPVSMTMALECQFFLSLPIVFMIWTHLVLCSLYSLTQKNMVPMPVQAALSTLI